jgi:Trk-type K+ transport system membrane component
LIVVTTFVLTYRQSASPADCLFESVSACTNSGLSTNLTGQLQMEDHLSGPWQIRIAGRCTIILAMMFGRVLPVAILLRWMSRKGQ